VTRFRDNKAKNVAKCKAFFSYFKKKLPIFYFGGNWWRVANCKTAGLKKKKIF